VLQCVAVCCSVLQCVAVCVKSSGSLSFQEIVCCSVLQCVAVCCSVSQCVLNRVAHWLFQEIYLLALLWRASNRGTVCVGCQKVSCVLLQRIVRIFSHPTHTCVQPRCCVCRERLLCCTALYIAGKLQCCSVLQYGAVCCSVMHCTAVDKNLWTPVILTQAESLVLKLKKMKTQLLSRIICQLLTFSVE